jgi:exosortase E/protease (VPEID-CTERM system)
MPEINSKQFFPYSFLFGLLLIIFEGLLISLQVDAKSINQDGWAGVLAYSGILLRWMIVTGSLCLCLFWLQKNISSLITPELLRRKPSLLYMAVHIGCYLLFFFATVEVFLTTLIITLPWVLIWLILLGLLLLSWVFTFLNPAHFIKFAQLHIKTILCSGLIAAFILVVTSSIESLWEPLSYITMRGSHFILLWFFDDLTYDIQEKLLGVNDFIVHIAPVCSGLEGLVISTSVTSLYIIFLREQLKFPLALVLIPIAAVLSILFNIFRIASLIAIGTIAPDLAIGGFHSVAGWIAAILVTFIIIFGFSSLSVFSKQKPEVLNDSQIIDEDGDLAWSILIPFILVLTATLISMVFNQGFNYWYPLKAIAGLVGLFIYWKSYSLKLPSKWAETIFTGALVAFIWIAIYPPDEEYNASFIAGLESMPLWFFILWFFSRALGGWFIIPIIEELVFRGYVLCRASNNNIELHKKITFSWTALIISSIIFGFIHTEFIAGVIAGVIFALLRFRGKSISEVIVAHMIANILVSFWALYTNNWVLL